MDKVGLKVQTLGPSLFYENSNYSDFFQTMFLLARVIPLVRISEYWTIFGGVRAQNPPKKSHFMDAKSLRKT